MRETTSRKSITDAARLPKLIAAQALAVAVAAPAAAPAQRLARAGDWPQWRGANRDNVSTETGLLKRWPKDGPPLAWKSTGVGEGYSSVSVAGGRIFTMGDGNDS